MKQTTWKKAAISSLAVLTLLGGATSAFADGKGKGHGKGHGNDNKDKKKEISINLKFKDEQELKWAIEHIMRLASKGVFNGYADGTFKPQQKITRIEALTAAVRLMGLGAQAESDAEMSTKLNFKDAGEMAKKYPWAVGYVAVAVENDLFAETDTHIQGDKPADRLWAATLLVKALKLSDEAKAKSNSELKFRDAHQIPAGSVGYVAVAIEKGLITGYEDNTFRPNQPVTRAELAALLDRTDSQLPDQDAQAVTGRLKAAGNGTLTITKPDNTDTVLALDANVFIFRNGVKAAPSALQVGDTLLVRTYQGKVVFVEVTQTAPEVTAFAEAGTINSVSLNSEGRLATISITKAVTGGTQALIYNVAPNVTISGNASLITTGQAVELHGVNGTVNAIIIK